MEKDHVEDFEERSFHKEIFPCKGSKAGNESSRSAIATELEHYLAIAFHAINARDWDYLNSPPTTNRIATFFKLMNATGMRPRADSKSELIADWQALVSKWPEYHLQIISMSTHVHDDNSRAEIFANCEVTGGPCVPVGISRKSVTVFEFQRVDGIWLGVKDTTIAGSGEDRV